MIRVMLRVSLLSVCLSVLSISTVLCDGWWVMRDA